MQAVLGRPRLAQLAPLLSTGRHHPPVPSTCPPLHPCTSSLNVRPSCPLLSHLQTGSIPGSLNLPISAIRNKLDEVPQGKKLYVHCAVSA